MIPPRRAGLPIRSRFVRGLALAITCIATTAVVAQNPPGTAKPAPFRTGNDAFLEDVRVLHEWTGETPGEQFGWVTRKVGDLDGDGVIDFASTAPTRRTNGPNSGHVAVYSSRSGKRLFAWDGKRNEQFGNSVAHAGDVNADGTPDVVVGAPAGGRKPGRAYVYSGKDGSVLLELTAEEAGDRFGLKVCSIGDLDGDGHADVAVGAPSCASTGKDAGRVYAYSGKSGDVLFTIDGKAAGDNFGSAIDGNRDADDPQLVVGAMKQGGTGRGYVYRLSAKDGATPFFTIEPDETAANLGQYFAVYCGDVDGDGTGDVAMTDWNNAAGGPGTGRLYVHSGKTGERVLTLTGDKPGAGFGTSISDAGDVDGDGRADFIVGSWQHPEGGASAGRCTLRSGKDGRVLATYTSTQPGDTLGFDATGVGDVDGDGGIDFVLSSAWSGIRGARSGRVFLVAGPTFE